MDKIKFILIDDEYFNRELIKTLISRLDSDFILMGEAENITEGYNKILAIKPDVVFLDIKMPDGSGFDLLKRFEFIDFEVVFVTGFDEYAIKAFDYNALDYVLKPIDLDKLKITLARVKSRIGTLLPELNSLESIVESIDNTSNIITKIPIHHNDKVILLSVYDIQYIMSNEGCTFFHKSKEEKYISSKQLSDFDFILTKLNNFVRINKGTYINLNFVMSYSKGFECQVTMQDNSKIEISRRKKAEILNLLVKREKK